MADAVKIIASLIDGRVVPWFSSEDPVPAKFVVVPPALYAEYKAGKIATGIALAKKSLADNAELGTAPQNVAVPPPPKKGGEDPSEVDPASIPQGEPTSPEVTHLPRTGTMRA